MVDVKIQFNNNLVDLIKMLRGSNKNNKECVKLLNEYYKNYTSKLESHFIDFIAGFVKNMSKYSKEILSMDDMLYSNDISVDAVYILNGIDFKILWKNLSDVDREYTWKKIKILYTLGLHILKTTDEYKVLFEKQKSIMSKLIDGMTQKHELDKEVKRQQIEEEIEDKINYEEIKEKFGDNIFTDIIIEIIKEFNIDKSVNPEIITSLIKDFTDKNSDDVNPMIEKIINKVKAKLVERNMTEEQLYAELSRVKDKFNDFFKNIPQFKDLIDKLTLDAKDIINKDDKDNKDEKLDPSFNGLEPDLTLLKEISSRLSEMDLSGLF